MICRNIKLKDCYGFLGENGKDPSLDIYLPYNMAEMGREKQKRPCIIICPGGAYAMCSERESEAVGVHFLSEGFNVFVLKYSVAPHRFPTQMREVGAVLELINANAEEWNCDTEKTVLMGFSAGGHLAAQYVNMYDCPQVREVFAQSKSVAACVLCYPVISAKREIAHSGSFINLLGHEPDSSEEEFFSCEKHVGKKTPPTYIWHTSQDDCVPVQNSILYAQALANAGVPFELHVFPFGGHGLSTCDKHTLDNTGTVSEYNSSWLSDLKKWLRLVLSGFDTEYID